MAWTKPEFTELRFGFEVTMYIANRWVGAARSRGDNHGLDQTWIHEPTFRLRSNDVHRQPL